CENRTVQLPITQRMKRICFMFFLPFEKPKDLSSFIPLFTGGQKGALCVVAPSTFSRHPESRTSSITLPNRFRARHIILTASGHRPFDFLQTDYIRIERFILNT
ncbi:hypothetical protein KKC97_09190, partial [bacterium]|nr:hypothetical protein [bacterium]